MPITENRETVERDNSDPLFQQILAMSPEQRTQLKTMAQQELAKTRQRSVFLQGGLQDLTNIFLQQGGLKTVEPKSSDLNNIVQKAILEDYIKSQTPEGKLARQKAQFELGQGGETAQPIAQPTPIATPATQENIPTGISTEKAPPQFTRKPSEKYPGYEYVENPDYKTYQTKQGKLGELDVKKVQLRDDLESFFAVDDMIDRAKGGFIDTKSAAFNTWWKSIDQPIDPITGLPDPKGAAAATHAAASKRLRVQLVRAAGDVGNINIVEQEAAEKLIPRWGDSQTTAKLKRAYLRQVAKSVNSGNENEVKKTLREIGIGFIEKKVGEQTSNNIPTMTGQDEEYQRYLQLVGGQ